MRRRDILAAGGLVLVLSACGGAELAVTVQRDVDDPETEAGTVTRALEGVEVQLVPFDRDQVFDSLEAAAPEPEPEIPDSVRQAQDAVRDAQEEWRAAEARWQTIRSRLQEIRNEMDGLNRGQARYVALFREFQDLEGQLNRLDRQQQQAFERFTELQSQSMAAAEQIRIQRDNWADEAFADVAEAMAARLKATGREILVDTTNAQGMVSFQTKAGEWWVHARYELPYEELYWNVPLTLEGGDPMSLILSEENAERRPRL